LFSFTKLGKQAKAIGDNPLSARQSGANVNLIKMLCYIVAGVCVGLASVFALARVGSVSENMGSGREMDVLIALILGGMNLSGGSKSRISSAVIGSITYVVLSNGLSLSGVATQYISIVKCVLFILIVLLTLRHSRNIRELPR
jgi:ribose transport system permease protein